MNLEAPLIVTPVLVLGQLELFLDLFQRYSLVDVGLHPFSEVAVIIDNFPHGVRFEGLSMPRNVGLSSYI